MIVVLSVKKSKSKMIKMILTTFLCLLILFILELRANPAPQTFVPNFNYNFNFNPNLSRLANQQNKTQVPKQQQQQQQEQQTFIEVFPDYPKNYIQSLDLQKYELFFGNDFLETFDLRFDQDEVGLCKSRKRLIFPKRGLTPQGTWLTIINNDDDKYRQGILVEECTENGSCDYSRNFPNGVESKCRQSYTYRLLLAINERGEPIKEHFQFPTCCKCMVTSGHRSSNQNRFGNDGKYTRATTDPDKHILPY